MRLGHTKDWRLRSSSGLYCPQEQHRRGRCACDRLCLCLCATHAPVVRGACGGTGSHTLCLVPALLVHGRALADGQAAASDGELRGGGLLRQILKAGFCGPFGGEGRDLRRCTEQCSRSDPLHRNSLICPSATTIQPIGVPMQSGPLRLPKSAKECQRVPKSAKE